MLIATLENAPAVPAFGGALIRMILTLGAMLVLGLAAIAAVRWWSGRGLSPAAGPGNAPALRVLQRAVLEPGRSVVLLEVDGERVLLGSTAQQVTLLSAAAVLTPADGSDAPGARTFGVPTGAAEGVAP